MTPSFDKWIYEHLGDEWCGNVVPPNDHQSLYFDMNTYRTLREVPEGCSHDIHVISWSEDACSLWIGSMDEWHTHFPRHAALKLTRWLLWRWAVGEWFGLRRWLWFQALQRIVDRYPKPKPEITIV
jgi:hypothetical protein